MRVVSFRSVAQIEEEFGDMEVKTVPKQRYSQTELIEHASGADALFVHSENEYSAELVDRVPELKAVGKPGSGIDNIDVEAATDRGVAVLHTPGMNAVAVAEYTVGALVSFARRLSAAEEHLRDGGWRSEEWWGTELRGKTVGIVGLGAAGFETARRLEPFDVELLVTDPYVSEEQVDTVDADRVPLEELVSNADVVSLHVRLTDETEGMFGTEQFDALDDDAILVNTSRGSVIEYDALRNALATDTIGGAVLDVFHEEPPDPSDPVFEHENVLATPHVAGATTETRVRMLRTTAKNVRRVLHGEPVDDEHVANPSVLE